MTRVIIHNTTVTLMSDNTISIINKYLQPRVARSQEQLERWSLAGGALLENEAER